MVAVMEKCSVVESSGKRKLEVMRMKVRELLMRVTIITRVISMVLPDSGVFWEEVCW